MDVVTETGVLRVGEQVFTPAELLRALAEHQLFIPLPGDCDGASGAGNTLYTGRGNTMATGILATTAGDDPPTAEVKKILAK